MSEQTTADGIFIKAYRLKAGEWLAQHAHVYDHATLVGMGAVRLWRRGVLDAAIHRSGAALTIRGGIKHAFWALEPTTLYCLHNALHPEVAAILEKHHLSADDMEDMIKAIA